MLQFSHFILTPRSQLDLLLDDNQTIVQSLNEGDLFGHIAVIEHAPHSHSVRAVKYSEVTSLAAEAYFSIVKESDKFEELITLEAIRQENLIAAAKKNIDKYPKLGKMQGGAASTEHNDQRRPTIKPMLSQDVPQSFAAAIQRQASKQGVRNSVVLNIVKGAEKSFRERSFVNMDKREMVKHDRERSVRRMTSNNPNFTASAKIYAENEIKEEEIKGANGGSA